MKSLSTKIFQEFGEVHPYDTIHVKAVKEFIKDLRGEFKVKFCLNPDVQSCGECAICKEIDNTLNIKAGPKLI